MVRLPVWVTKWLGSSSGTTSAPATSQSVHIILCPYVKLMQTSRLYTPSVCVYACVHSVVSNSLQPCGLYIVHQAWLSMGFPRQEHWSRLHFLLQGIFPTQGLKLHLLHQQTESLPPEKLVHVLYLVTQSCLTLWDSTDSSPPGSYSPWSIAKIVRWIATQVFIIIIIESFQSC